MPHFSFEEKDKDRKQTATPTKTLFQKLLSRNSNCRWKKLRISLTKPFERFLRYLHINSNSSSKWKKPKIPGSENMFSEHSPLPAMHFNLVPMLEFLSQRNYNETRAIPNWAKLFSCRSTLSVEPQFFPHLPITSQIIWLEGLYCWHSTTICSGTDYYKI